MKPFLAMIRKEVMEQARSGRGLILAVVFVLLGIMNPAVAKLTPALLSMMISQAATGVTGFQANPARIDVNTGEMLFAHCTVPFNMVKDYCFDTHFESGIGVGIHGNLPEGAVTVFKVSGDLSRCFVAEGQLLRNQYEPNLCRTQVVLKLQPDDARYFLTDPIGNHHIIIPGHHAALLQHIVDAI